MKLKYFLLVLSILFWVGCEDKDVNGDSDVTVESVSGTYNISSVTVHSGGDCSVDNGTSGLCLPDISVSQSDCVETGVGFCMNDDGDEIEGIDAEADCCGDNTWNNMGWNTWVVMFCGLTVTFSDDGTYVVYDESGIWTLDGATLTMTNSEGEVSTATVSGNTLTAELIDAIISDVDCAVMVFTK